MNKQRGGKLRVSGWLSLLLLALAIGEAGYIRYLLKHRQIVIEMNIPAANLELPSTVIKPPDEYVMHAFPEKRQVCDSFNTICWIRI